jgi:hypothetical protein
LQHAWAIATHDLVYKSDAASWSKERIAFQIKAMLEHAELSIQEAERLSESPAVKKDNRQISSIQKCIEILRSQWEGEDELPKDIRRLAVTIAELLDALGLKPSRLSEILEAEKVAANGAWPLSLSPYAIIVQSLLRLEKERMSQLLTNQKARFKITIPSEVDFPEDIPRATCCSAVFIGQPKP